MADGQYREDLNTGLPSTFVIKDGKFCLQGGSIKAEDNIRMMLAFSKWYREYYMDFCVDISWLLQKPTNYVQTFKTLILGRFISAAEKYIPFIKVKKMNVVYQYTDRKSVIVGIEYLYNLASPTTLQFIQIINAI